MALLFEIEPDDGVTGAVPHLSAPRHGDGQTPESDIVRFHQRERTEGVSAVRGLMFGVAFSAPLFALLVWGVCALTTAVG